MELFNGHHVIISLISFQRIKLMIGIEKIGHLLQVSWIENPTKKLEYHYIEHNETILELNRLVDSG